jgi:[CysO sulfur-carrier protein]-S-L-cysteine hydrolase
MIHQARAEFPNECCGLLAGRISEDGMVAEVTERYPLINEMKSPTEFVSEPRSHLAAERDIRQRGLDVLVVYHSHPTSEPIPSKRDLERNYSERVMNLIIGVAKTPHEMRGWWLGESTFADAAWELASNPQSEIPNPK